MFDFSTAMATNLDWYWVSSDGLSVFSAARAASFGVNDVAYRDWLARSGRKATPWPKDTEGNDSDVVLASVLAPYGVYVTLLDYAKMKRWAKHTGGTVIGGVPIQTDADSKILITGSRIAANADPEWSTVWDAADGNSYPINAAQMIAISDGLQAFVNGCFATFAIVKAAIEAGEITTQAEIDAAFA